MFKNMRFEFHHVPKSPVLALSFLLLAWSPANVRAQASPAQPPPDMTGKTAGQFYKNVKVLTDIPAVDLHPAMEYITVALGVGCGNCHDTKKFDSDDKANKRTARGMIQMEFALNNAIFDKQTRVTCYTCHRGEPAGAAFQVLAGDKAPPAVAPSGTYPPLAVPNVMLNSTMAVVREAPGSTAATAPPAAANAKTPVVLPSVAEVLAKYMQSLGSAEAVKNASTLVETGTVEMELPNPPGTPPGPPKMGRVDAEIERKAPDEVLYLIHLPTTLSMEGYDGSMAWLKGGVSREETGGERAVVQEKANFFPLQHFEDTHSRVTVDGVASIGNRQAYRVSGFRQDGMGYDHFYVDTDTGELLRLSTNMNSVLGSFPVDIDYQDYRDVDGLKLPFTMRDVSPEGERTYTWDKIVVNGTVEDGAFKRPAPTPPAGGPPPAR